MIKVNEISFNFLVYICRPKHNRIYILLRQESFAKTSASVFVLLHNSFWLFSPLSYPSSVKLCLIHRCLPPLFLLAYLSILTFSFDFCLAHVFVINFLHLPSLVLVHFRILYFIFSILFLFLLALPLIQCLPPSSSFTNAIIRSSFLPSLPASPQPGVVE